MRVLKLTLLASAVALFVVLAACGGNGGDGDGGEEAVVLLRPGEHKLAVEATIEIELIEEAVSTAPMLVGVRQTVNLSGTGTFDVSPDGVTFNFPEFGLSGTIRVGGENVAIEMRNDPDRPSTGTVRPTGDSLSVGEGEISVFGDWTLADEELSQKESIVVTGTRFVVREGEIERGLAGHHVLLEGSFSTDDGFQGVDLVDDSGVRASILAFRWDVRAQEGLVVPPEPMDEPDAGDEPDEGETFLTDVEVDEIIDSWATTLNSDPSLFGLEGYSLNSGRTGDLTDEAYTNFSFIPLDLTAGSGRVGGQVSEYNNPRVAVYQKRFLGAAFTDREAAQEWYELSVGNTQSVGATNGDGETLDAIELFEVDPFADLSAGMVQTLHSATAPEYHSVSVLFVEGQVFSSVTFYITEEPDEDVQQQILENGIDFWEALESLLQEQENQR